VRIQERKAQETAAGTVNAVFTTPTPPSTREEEKKKPPPTMQKEGKKKIFGPPLPEGRKKVEEREGQQPPTCSSGQVQAAAAPMGLPKTLTGQFVFFKQINNSHTFFIKQGKSTMLITVPSLIAAGIATTVVTGGITGTAVYLTAGEADVVTGDQIKTEGGLHILELGHMEPWAIAMMCANILIGMGTCGACCHKRGKSYVTDKEAKLRDRALGRAKELVHLGPHGADKLLKDVQTYHDKHQEIVTQKMHQITPPRIGGKYGERPCGNPQCSECPKPRHIAVGFSNSRQEATILIGGRQTNKQQLEERSSSPTPSAANSRIEGQSSSRPAADSSPPRQIAALTPPRVVTAPSELFDNNKPADIFISPHIPRIPKWDPIANGMLEKPPVDNVDYTHMIPAGLN
jgi:hypothetical protein